MGLFGLNLLPAPKEKAPFLSAYPYEGHLGRREVKVFQQTSKVESDSITVRFLLIPFCREPEKTLHHFSFV